MRNFLVFALLALAGPASAEFAPMATAVPDSVPNGMNYQGRLEKDGFPVTGSKTMAFRLYDAASGGTALYNSGNMTVTVQQGMFSVSLDIPFGALTGTSQKYLELEVEGVTLTPRDALRSVPYAKVAETVEGTINVSTAGLTFSTPVGDALAISSISGRVGIGTASPAARLHVSSGTGETGVILLVSTGATTLVSADGLGIIRSHGLVTGFTTILGTLAVQGNAFSVGTSTFAVIAGRVGINTATPPGALTLVGDMGVTQQATFGSSVTVAGAVGTGGSVGVGTLIPQTTLEVNGSAQFGSGAVKSTFSTTGALALNTNARLSVGATFYVDNGAVVVSAASGSTYAMRVNGDLILGNVDAHDFSAGTDIHVQGNVIVDGLIKQHGTAGSVIDSVGIVNPLVAGQTFAVGYTSFVVMSDGLIGIGTTAPGAKLTLVGDLSVTQPATFKSSASVAGAAGVGGTLGVAGTTTLTSSVTALGNVGVGGNTALAGALGVDQAATLKGSMTVVGASGVGGTLGVTGNTALSGALGVDQAATVKGSMTVVGASGVGGTLGVAGNTALAAGLGVDLAATVKGSMSVVGAAGVGGALGVTGNTALAAGLGVDLAATVKGSMTVVGTSGFTGNAAFTGALGVSGTTTLTSSVTVQGKLGFSGTAPGVSACGTGPLITGSDSAGKVTIGTGATTSCTLTFSAAYAAAPACTVIGNNSAANLAATSSTTQLVFTSSADMASYVVMYVCVGL